MDTLMNHHSLDIQWGNHDILWMGAASGSRACMANVIRIALRYDTLGTLENAYGINLSPLVRFTLEKYKDEQISPFTAKEKRKTVKEKDIHLMSRMQKAIAVIQFKLEGQIIQRRPDFKMDNRLLLSQMDLKKGIVTIEGKDYQLKDTTFPTIDPESPYELTADELDVMEKLEDAFTHSEKLQSHVKFLNRKGSMYKVFNKNLLYHACIPMTSEGLFKSFTIDGKTYKGKALLDYFDDAVNTAYYSKDKKAKEKALDLMWYLWCGETSPLFGKKKMATFERYFIDDSCIHKEAKNPYYNLRHEEKTCHKILEAFGLTDDHCHIVNGHVPVKVKKGESPIKGGGKLIAIDGGFSKAYQGVTGIAGYTLIYNSQGIVLVSHEAFNSKRDAIEKDLDMLPTTEFVQVDRPQMFVADTDIGKKLQSEIDVLKELLEAYQTKRLKQK
jgi:fructose-1,6-bisphosphatase-3